MNFLSLMPLLLSFNLMAASVDLDKSSLVWEGSKVTGKHNGTLRFKSAQLQTNATHAITAGEFIVDINSLSVTDLQGEWKDKFENHIKSADFFDTSKYPTSKLVIEKSDNNNKLYGKLTIKGKTNPITIEYKKDGSEYKGVMKFNRTKYDMVYGSGSFFKNLGDKMINDEVKVDFKVVLK